VTQVVPHMKHRPRAAARRRSGFTLIEMLIVIVIILFLLAIGIYGYRSLERSTAEKQTRTNLTNADALLKGMNGIGATARLEGPDTLVPMPVFPLLTATKAFPDPPTFPSPGDVNVGKPGRATALTKCYAVMRALQQSPENKKAIAALPPNMIVPPDPGQVANPNLPPALADAWGNPLIYVPTGGLTGVAVNNVAVTVTSTGQLRNPGAYPNPTQDPAVQNRGFWASAGPDGDFNTGDDNVYSFQK
jgi:prepilin-type N-terminal cleavage/methylation domain-containing protein